eukprot:TRINITY_DN14714_c1_g1_i1.p2 TRINITY_DN14714_c1_g1~~TRINITY_DN14714_c1_g1_i1.p2  ORF type:complete len:559 (+),score=185.19 TRINITY_DN14714_c1_g1_i1:82-1677(+)
MAQAEAPAPQEQQQQPPLHIVSWNVAGWETAARGIAERDGGLAGWLERHRIDILCLQEVKLTSDAVAAPDGPKNPYGARLPKYDTFWACADGKRAAGRNGGSAQQGRGLNGVATFARTGLTSSANAAPLGVEELDREGRCILTEHGNVSLFNVYVPNSGQGSKRLPYKMRFLSALRKRMQERRAKGQRVVLVGDLNLAPRPVDVFWQALRVRPAELVAAGRPELEGFVSRVTRCWPAVHAALQAAVPREEVVNSAQGRRTKYRLVAQGPTGQPVKLGKPEDGPGDLGFSSEGYEVDGHIVKEAGTLRVHELMDAVEKLAPDAAVGATARTWADLAAVNGAPPYPPDALKWFNAVTEEDGMVDAFAAAHPRARERFTVWQQYTNRRYENQGTRIDITLVDRDLWRVRAGGRLSCGGADCADPCSEEAALSACTAGRLFRPAPMTGGGIPPCSHKAYEAQFLPEPHTGMLYTPPELSDHIPVCLLLDAPAELRGGGVALRGDAATRACQPHKAQKTLAAYFSAAPKRPRVQQP